VAVGARSERHAWTHAGKRCGHQAAKDGVIADFKVTEKMLTYFIQKAHNRRVLVHPRIVIGVPSEITPVESARCRTPLTGRAAAKFIWWNRPCRGDWRGAADRGAQRKHGGGYWRGTTDIAVISMSGSCTRGPCAWRATRWTKP